MKTAIYKLDDNNVILFRINEHPTTVKSYRVHSTQNVSLRTYNNSIKINRLEAIKLLRSFIFEYMGELPTNIINRAIRLRDRLIKENRCENLIKCKFIDSYNSVISDGSIVVVTSMDKIMDAYNDFIESEKF